MKRLGRYLKAHPRYVIRYAKQKDVYCVNAFADTDWAGDKTIRKSTSGGVLQIGSHVVKSLSTTQATIALSNGEAELYATNKGAAHAIGLQSLLADMGLNLEIRLFTDSSTAKAITKRTGLGKIRHLDVKELWLQQKTKHNIITHHNIKNTFNCADLLAKPQDAATIRSMMELVDHVFEDGRSIVAPNLNALTDYNLLELHICYLEG